MKKSGRFKIVTPELCLFHYPGWIPQPAPWMPVSNRRIGTFPLIKGIIEWNDGHVTMDARIPLGLICFLVCGVSSWTFPLIMPSSNPVSLSADMQFFLVAGLVIMWTLMSSVLLLFVWRGIRRATRILGELEEAGTRHGDSL